MLCVGECQTGVPKSYSRSDTSHQSTACHPDSRKWPSQQACRLSTSTWVIGQPLMDQDSPFHLGLMYLSSATGRPVLLLNFLWTHSLHREHLSELLPTPLQQTPQGYLSDFIWTSRPTPETMNLIFFMLTRIPLLSITAFHTLSLEIYSSWVFPMSTRSSA